MTEQRNAGLVTTGAEKPCTHSLPRLLTVDNVAAALGLRPATVYAWVAARKLPVVRLGRSVRIPAEVLRRLIETNTVPARNGGAL
jgi:excisionase family DNA binding protein